MIKILLFIAKAHPLQGVKTLLQKSELKHSFEFSIEGKACALRASYIVEEIKAQSRRD
jgi:hypothetical protein